MSICDGNLLDRQDYHYEKWATMSYNSSNLISKKQKCRSCYLLQYTTERAVNCFDVFYQEKAIRNKKVLANESKMPRLHFVFMGDSRIRQQYYNFLKVIQ
jgi:hypothetical protein